MTKIMQAPFNFVPQASTIYTPEWADQISQDIPFEDGLDGSIDVKITACSPIFVKNGEKRSKTKNERIKPEYFSQTADGRYFIPGSSVKGAIRNVLEIMSMGKLSTDPNAQFAQREWTNKDLESIKNHAKEIKGGWIKQNTNGSYIVTEAKHIYRINQEHLDTFLGDKIFKNHFLRESRFNLNKPDPMVDNIDPKTAFYKYRLIEKIGKTNSFFSQHTFSKDNAANKGYLHTRLKFDKNGNIKGYIVITGQPAQADTWKNRNKRSKGKFYEFVFDANNGQELQLSREEFEHFKFIYKDSPEWKLFNLRIQSEKGMPVFFRIKDGKIQDLGLTFMYKLPYQHTPAEIAERKQPNKGYDLAECIFGYTSNANSLKGRVQFSHFYADKDAEIDSETRLILNSPKASYYPIYIKQDENNGKVKNKYRTYNNGELKGFKRYLLRQNVWSNFMNNNLDSIITPLKAGTEFTGKINFHNLRPIELGALISALTFHMSKDKNIYHQIGKGKPYGYGKVRIEISPKFFGAGQKPNTLVAKFEKEMMINNENWLHSDTLKELFTIAHEEITPKDTSFKYMSMGINKNDNDFINAKSEGNKEYLEYYSKLKHAQYFPTSAIND